uniref:Origin recognition complex subunit 2 n=1 Tax=Xenopus laevis TaxID=8355 RepID=ORC2_XENLA|nr:RecName: Full=Origin recognition complex subunit 2; Short=xORC2 [Xenopus laevis]AAA96391.1 XORC2 [Xenopus laevis]prf//2204391A orc-2-related protein [Xenopus laevis]
MSHEAHNGTKLFKVQFTPDEEVLEHITDKQGVTPQSNTAAQRIVAVKNIIKNDDLHVDEATPESWREQNYVDVLGVDTEDTLQNGPGTGGGDVYSFYTIKRSNKMAQLATEMARTPAKTVSFSVSDNPEEAVSPPANKQTENKTPSKGRKNEFISTTPHRLRKRLSAPSQPSDSESDYSASNSDEELEEKSSAAKTPSKVSQTPGKTPSKKGKKNTASNLVEEYFEAHSSSKVLTSDRTLQRLQTPKLDQETLRKLLDQTPSAFADELHRISKKHEALFYKWMLQLHLGFNIILFGLGSKQSLIEKFRTSLLQDSLHIVINEFFPSITAKSILNSITEEALGHPGAFRSPLDQMDFILQRFKDDPSLELYLLIHNLDSQMLRGEKCQQVLGQLASIPNLHLLASVDHINAPLMWDQSKQSLYNWLWYETTTFGSYIEETSYENSLLVKRSGALALSSLTHVLRSLTPNARGIFRLLAEYQMANKDNPSYTGLSFQDFYQQCREAFLVNSDLTLRAQLTEFRDHKLIRTKKGMDGVEYLLIPLDLGTLTDFLEMEDKDT